MKYMNIRTYTIVTLFSLMLASLLSTTGPAVSKKQNEKEEALMSSSAIEVYTSSVASDAKLSSVRISNDQETLAPSLSDPAKPSSSPLPSSTFSPLPEEPLQTVEHLPLYVKTESQVITDQTDTPRLTYLQKRNGYLKDIVGYSIVVCLTAPFIPIFLRADDIPSTGARIGLASPYVVASVPSAIYVALTCYKLGRLCCGKEDQQ